MQLNDAHWTMPHYRQRMTTKEWKQALLKDEDTIIFHGRVMRLTAKSLGHGVVEVYKSHPIADERKESDNEK